MRKLCAVLLFVPLLIACGSIGEWKYLPDSPRDEKIIYVVSHGWHTGIIIPGNMLGDELGFFEDHFGNNKYYEIGWGDKDFYQAKKVTSKITLQAIFWPTKSVMHVVAVTEFPEIYFSQSEIIKIKISTLGFNHLKSAINKSFKKNAEQAVKIKSGLYGQSLFFQAEGYFHITHTCNSWTAEMLQAAGMPINPALTVTSEGVMGQVQDALDQCLWCRTEYLPD